MTSRSIGLPRCGKRVNHHIISIIVEEIIRTLVEYIARINIGTGFINKFVYVYEKYNFGSFHEQVKFEKGE